jgi:hypothetical protein
MSGESGRNQPFGDRRSGQGADPEGMTLDRADVYAKAAAGVGSEAIETFEHLAVSGFSKSHDIRPRLEPHRDAAEA